MTILSKQRVLAIFLILVPLPSFATVVLYDSLLTQGDFQSTGDNLLTVDSIAKLEWLDLTETKNISYNDVKSRLLTTSSNSEHLI